MIWEYEQDASQSMDMLLDKNLQVLSTGALTLWVMPDNITRL